MDQVVQSGARGATIGRNVWGVGPVASALKAFKGVIHEGRTPDQALSANGLTGDE